MKVKRPWLSLVTFCTAAACATALALALLVSGATAAFAGADSQDSGSAGAEQANGSVSAATEARGQTFAGLITDDRCRARHERNSGMGPSECARMCVRNGAKYLLVSGDKKYTLDGDAEQLASVAGERANITGTAQDGTIRVSSIAASQ